MSQNMNTDLDAERTERADKIERTEKAEKSDKSEKNLADLPFEKLLHQLEVIVEHLEKGELTLERSLVAYERGMVIARAAQSRLDDMERRIETLTAEGRIVPMTQSNTTSNAATTNRSSDENPRKKS